MKNKKKLEKDIEFFQMALDIVIMKGQDSSYKKEIDGGEFENEGLIAHLVKNKHIANAHNVYYTRIVFHKINKVLIVYIKDTQLNTFSVPIDVQENYKILI